MCIDIKGKLYPSISNTHATLVEISYVVLAMMTVSFTTGSNSTKQTVWCTCRELLQGTSAATPDAHSHLASSQRKEYRGTPEMQPGVCVEN